MIIVYLKGGLGNQLFQYALGRHLAEIHNTELKLDVSAYGYSTPQADTFCGLRKYALHPFSIKENFASREQVKQLTEVKQTALREWLHNLLHKHPPRPRSFICGNYTSFNPGILKLPDNVYLEGYWQSEKYFLGISRIIHREFAVKTPQSGRDRELAEQMASTCSVAVSVRRGDYASQPKKQQTHGLCDRDYYLRCVEFIVQKLAKPHFFVFSDEIAWCRENLKLPYPVVFIDHNGPDKIHENLRLMSQCRHDIISNSTFAWWGAWLNQNPDKIVLAPEKWFAKADKSSADLLPDRWIKL
ncbi:MAG: alpha-1,2-fucosyltransferase [Planctomycetota bacterium]